MAGAIGSFLTGPTGPTTTLFWGPIANWGLAGSGIYDAIKLGPEVINERMCATQVIYSGLFARFAWCVAPRNYILLGCHVANVTAQSNQLRRWGEHTWATDDDGPTKVRNAGILATGVLGGIAATCATRGTLQKTAIASTKAMPSLLRAPAAVFFRHPAGPFFIHFWAPNFKWALSLNNLLDYDRPVEKISLSMTSALTLTGCIFMRFSFVITPVNYSLFIVNLALSTSSGYLLARKVKAEYID
eukprot:NODE_11146_length_1304_cov_7.228547.p1 GENE.NODE_11146_length_1304_cov_7.228547~~NODE_11146_length_1304_cov_7.228547.p1  ORF type:complete len:244 (+),score=73.54 NODE_11146_length_1304_cov_7.228547:145-876(+)